MHQNKLLLEVLQWGGAMGIIIGHVLNAVGPSMYPYNIIAFFVGSALFLTWAAVIKSKPQITVNLVSILIGAIGLVNAFVAK